jgi:hypothetical protein
MYNGNKIRIKQRTENKIKQTCRKIEGQNRYRNGEIKRKHGEKGKESKVQRNKEHSRRERDVKRERAEEASQKDNRSLYVHSPILTSVFRSFTDP